jgi:DNA-binding transcriptional MerR regulator
MVYSRVVTEMPKEIPRRAVYKAAEVCEIARIQPYVLRSWESEFSKLGVVRGGTRIYRRADLEQVLRIKQLVFEEGLTLAGARRRLEEDAGPQPELPLEEFVTPDMKQRIGRVRQGLNDLLGMLGGPARVHDGHDAPRAGADGQARAPAVSADAGKTPRKSDGHRGAKAHRQARSHRRHMGHA